MHSSEHMLSCMLQDQFPLTKYHSQHFKLHHSCVGHWEAVREVAGRPPPIGGHCMVRFDSHRAVMYGGTSRIKILDSLYVVDLETRVGEVLM